MRLSAVSAPALSGNRNANVDAGDGFVANVLVFIICRKAKVVGRYGMVLEGRSVLLTAFDPDISTANTQQAKVDSIKIPK